MGAVAEFSEALLVIPKTLAMNAALDAADLVSRLRVHHNTAQTSSSDEHKEYKWFGLDLLQGKVRNSVQAGVLEPLVGKLKALKFATEAAITILALTTSSSGNRSLSSSAKPAGPALIYSLRSSRKSG